ncbi:CinA family protein [Sulfurovum sp. bin170]|uniref:CinA family protein n=1 Tax=Sulfurovum sp. bin170 TaxID=2695268 RepID=UPI0013E0DE97|nr:CinA family protein [Sulfurovum sp. bin170]NEW60785.1 CinA family protein [Sulfurovum sp. bin170]
MKKNTTKQNSIDIINILKEKNQTISFAESCTGGRIASEFTAISGASAVLNGSCVTYSNEIKSKWLGVSEETLMEHGAVSKECVEEMLKGIAKLANADYTIAVSGIAGPTGGTDEKPVGTVYIGILNQTNIIIERHLFKGERESVQLQATDTAIALLKKNL